MLRHVRVSRGISQRVASKRCGLSAATVGHYENGRMEISDFRLNEFLKIYGCDRKDFDDYMNGKEVPIISVKEDCINLLGRIDEAKLRTVHAVLVGFAGG